MSISVLPAPEGPSCRVETEVEVMEKKLESCDGVYVLFQKPSCGRGDCSLEFFEGTKLKHSPEPIMAMKLNFESLSSFYCCNCWWLNCGSCKCGRIPCCNCGKEIDESSVTIESKDLPSPGTIIFPIFMGLPWIMYKESTFTGKFIASLYKCFCSKYKFRDHVEKELLSEKECEGCDCSRSCLCFPDLRFWHCFNCCIGCCGPRILRREYVFTDTKEQAFSIYQV